MSLYRTGWTSRQCRCRPLPFAWRLLRSRRWEELWGKREPDQRQDPTEFPISYTKDAWKHYICCIPSFRECGRRPRSMMSGRKQRAIYIPKEKDSKGLNQFRPISLLNVEWKIFFSIMASRLTEFVMSNKYVDISVKKGGIPGVPGCIEHTSMIWEAIQRAKRSRLGL